MDAVVQQEPTGCGIAACAALTQIDYGQARQVANALGIFAEDRALWSDTHYVRRLLGELGIVVAPEQHPFDGWEALPDRALLAIKWRLVAGRPFWHWVVFVRDAEGCAGLKKSPQAQPAPGFRAHEAQVVHRRATLRLMALCLFCDR